MVYNCLSVSPAENNVFCDFKAQNDAGTLSDREYLLLLLRENTSVTQTELASVMNISRRSEQMLMKELAEY